MFCSACGNKLHDGAMFCAVCGTAVPAQAMEQQAREIPFMQKSQPQ